MAFAADDYVGVIPFEMLIHHIKAVGIKVASGIDESDDVTPGFGHAEPDGVAFAMVGRIAGNHKVPVPDSRGFTLRSVGLPINHQDDLIAGRQCGQDSPQIGLNGTFLVISRNYDGQKPVVIRVSCHGIFSD